MKAKIESSSSSKNNFFTSAFFTKVEKLLFLSIFFLSISQFGKHFWPDFARVFGIRVDYLSPTIYLLDIFIVALLILSIATKGFSSSEFLKRFLIHPVFLFFLSSLFFSSLLAQNISAAVFGIAKLLEFIFLGWYVSQALSRIKIRLIVDVFLISSCITAVIALWQFVIQHSIGNVFYFLGERTFYPSTPGIALFPFHDTLMLRPYATFPHPNLLAFFLFFSIFIVLYGYRYKKTLFSTRILICALVLLHIALFLTFSRIILFLYCGVTLIRLIKRPYKVLGVIVITFIAVFILIFQQRFFTSVIFSSDLSDRIELLRVALIIWKQNMWFGVGINNFFFHEIEYQKTLSSTLLQPVHNIYVFYLVQLGIAGFLPILYFLWKTYRKIYSAIRQETVVYKKDFYVALYLIFITALIVGMFDHYLVTLEQGQLFTAVILGFCWGRVTS